MNILAYFLVAIVVLAAACFLLRPLVNAYLKYRGTRVITCPETCKPEAVVMNAGRAALSAVGGKPHLQLSDCSGWPEREDCGQECLRQIELAPDECLVRTILRNWYWDRNCAFCDKPIGEINWLDNKPALMSPEKVTALCSDVPPETLQEVLSTHLPVCYDCHIAETFRRLYPYLVVDRPWKGEIQHQDK